MPQTETTPFHPRTPYGVAKAYAHFITRQLPRELRPARRRRDPLQPRVAAARLEFVTRKITRRRGRDQARARRTSCCSATSTPGATGATRGDYVRAMWLMLQQDEPDDYVIATGETTACGSSSSAAFATSGSTGRSTFGSTSRCARDGRAPRPRRRRVEGTRACSAGRPRVDFDGLVQLLVDADLERLRAQLEPAGVTADADAWRRGKHPPPLAPVGRPLRRAAVQMRTRGWSAHSRLFVGFDAAGWVLEYEARQLERTATALGVGSARGHGPAPSTGQSVFHASQFALSASDFERRGNRLGVAYLHGRPGTPGMPEFDACYEPCAAGTRRSSGSRCRHRAMEELVLDAGVAAGEGVPHPDRHRPRALPRSRRRAERAEARASSGCPESAFVVGSFQKDGVGWGEGLEPKLIKGPDVLLAAVERLRERVPELVVLLTGPARGYVNAGLERLGVAYRHVLLPRRRRRRAGVPRARRLSRHLARRGWAEGGARGDGDRRTARDDARRPGGGPRRARRERLARRRRGRDGSPTGVGHVARGARRDARARPARGRRATAEAHARTRRSRRAGASCSTASSTADASVSAYARRGRARRRAVGADRARRGRRAAEVARLLRPRPRARARRAGRGRDRRSSSASQTRFPNRPRDFNLLYLGSSSLPRDVRAADRARAAPRRAGRRQPGRRRVSRLGGRPTRSGSTRRSGARARRPTTSSTRASSGSSRPTSSSASPRGSWEILQNAVDIERFTPAEHAPPGGPVLLLGGDQSQAYRLELALRDARACCRAPARAARHGRLVVGRRAADRRARARRTASTSSAATRSATRRRSSAARTCSCIRRCSDPCPNVVLEALACGLPVVHPASGGTAGARRRRRRHRRPASGQLGARRAALAGGARRRGRRACSPTSRRTPSAARARAVERFALEPWLDRHAELFERLAPRSRASAAERRRVVAGTRPSSRARATAAPADGTDEHARDGPRRVAVLAQEVADARAVAEARSRASSSRTSCRTTSAGRTRCARPRATARTR